MNGNALSFADCCVGVPWEPGQVNVCVNVDFRLKRTKKVNFNKWTAFLVLNVEKHCFMPKQNCFISVSKICTKAHDEVLGEVTWIDAYFPLLPL